MIDRLRLIGDRMTLYLPIILMGLFALGTYWLVRSTPLILLHGQETQVRHEPDYFMRNFSVKTFSGAGRLQTEVLGTDARHFPDTDTLEIDLVRIRSFSDAGGVTIATARRAVTDDNATEVQLFGEARVVRESTADIMAQAQPRMEFRGEFLHAFMDTQRLSSDKPVELSRGDDRFTADSMEFDNIKRVMDLKGRVKGTLLSAPGK